MSDQKPTNPDNLPEDQPDVPEDVTPQAEQASSDNTTEADEKIATSEVRDTTEFDLQVLRPDTEDESASPATSETESDSAPDEDAEPVSTDTPRPGKKRLPDIASKLYDPGEINNLLDDIETNFEKVDTVADETETRVEKSVAKEEILQGGDLYDDTPVEDDVDEKSASGSPSDTKPEWKRLAEEKFAAEQAQKDQLAQQRRDYEAKRRAEREAHREQMRQEREAYEVRRRVEREAERARKEAERAVVDARLKAEREKREAERRIADEQLRAERRARDAEERLARRLIDLDDDSDENDEKPE